MAEVAGLRVGREAGRSATVSGRVSACGALRRAGGAAEVRGAAGLPAVAAALVAGSAAAALGRGASLDDARAACGVARSVAGAADADTPRVAITRAEERLLWVTRYAMARPSTPLGIDDLPREAAALKLEAE